MAPLLCGGGQMEYDLTNVEQVLQVQAVVRVQESKKY